MQKKQINLVASRFQYVYNSSKRSWRFVRCWEKIGKYKFKQHCKSWKYTPKFKVQSKFKENEVAAEIYIYSVTHVKTTISYFLISILWSWWIWPIHILIKLKYVGLHVKVGSLSYKLEDYMTSNQNRFNYKKESSSKLASDVILSGHRNAAGHNTDAYAATNT